MSRVIKDDLSVFLKIRDRAGFSWNILNLFQSASNKGKTSKKRTQNQSSFQTQPNEQTATTVCTINIFLISKCSMDALYISCVGLHVSVKIWYCPGGTRGKK